MTGINKAGNALNVVLGNSFNGTIFSVTKFLFLDIHPLINIKKDPISSPGMIPAKNKKPIELLEITEYKTIGIEGGIMGPIVADAAVIAAA
jgi:hypothetical protein